MSKASSRSQVRGRNAVQRGFTLVELMVVVVIMGILATIGTQLFRSHIRASKTSEATSVIRAIAAAQENMEALTSGYLDVSTNLETFYPATAPGEFRSHWVQTGHADQANWDRLKVDVDRHVMFGYATVAGAAGQNPNTDPAILNHVLSDTPVSFPAAPGHGWYVIQAVGDTDGDGRNAVLVAASFSKHIHIEDE